MWYYEATGFARADTALLDVIPEQSWGVPIMAATAPAGASTRAQTGDFWILAKSFERSLLAANRSPATIRIYTISVDQFGRFLEARSMPLTVASITREHVEEFINDVLGRSKPGTAETRYRGLQAFFKWAVEDGEIR